VVGLVRDKEECLEVLKEYKGDFLEDHYVNGQIEGRRSVIGPSPLLLTTDAQATQRAGRLILIHFGWQKRPTPLWLSGVSVFQGYLTEIFFRSQESVHHVWIKL
jgi:hypothetical protein